MQPGSPAPTTKPTARVNLISTAITKTLGLNGSEIAEATIKFSVTAVGGSIYISGEDPKLSGTEGIGTRWQFNGKPFDSYALDDYPGIYESTYDSSTHSQDSTGNYVISAGQTADFIVSSHIVPSKSGYFRAYIAIILDGLPNYYYLYDSSTVKLQTSQIYLNVPTTTPAEETSCSTTLKPKFIPSSSALSSIGRGNGQVAFRFTLTAPRDRAIDISNFHITGYEGLPTDYTAGKAPIPVEITSVIAPIQKQGGVYTIPAGRSMGFNVIGAMKVDKQGYYFAVLDGIDWNCKGMTFETGNVFWGGLTMPKTNRALIYAPLVGSCASEGGKYSKVYANYPKTCCAGLLEWMSGMDTTIEQNGQCVQVQTLVAGSPIGTCLKCGDGVCKFPENKCNCAADCGESNMQAGNIEVSSAGGQVDKVWTVGVDATYDVELGKFNLKGKYVSSVVTQLEIDLYGYTIIGVNKDVSHLTRVAKLYDGDAVLGSATVADDGYSNGDISAGDGHAIVRFNNLNLIINKDTTKTLTVKIDVAGLGSGPNDGDYLEFAFRNLTGRDDNGLTVPYNDTWPVSAKSKRTFLYDNYPVISLVSATMTKSTQSLGTLPGASKDTGFGEIVFKVKAIGGDIQIKNNLANAYNPNQPMTSIASNYSDPDQVLLYVGSIKTTAEPDANAYIVRTGDTKTFTITGAIVPRDYTGRYYYIWMDALVWDTIFSDEFKNIWTSSTFRVLEDWRTNAIWLKNNEGYEQGMGMGMAPAQNYAASAYDAYQILLQRIRGLIKP